MPESATMQGESQTETGRVPDIDVVVVNWNTGGELGACIEQLKTHGGGRVEEIVVVDNDSSDDSLSRLGNPPGVTVIHAGRNLGFAAGANLNAGYLTGFRNFLNYLRKGEI